MEQSDYQNYHITQDELKTMRQEVMSYIDNLATNAVFKKYPYLKSSFKTLTDPFEQLAHIDILNRKIADTKVKNKLAIDKIWKEKMFELANKKEADFREEVKVKKLIDEQHEAQLFLDMLELEKVKKKNSKPIINKTGIGAYADLTNYPSKDNQISIEFHSYKASKFYPLKKIYSQDNLLYETVEKYSSLKSTHHQSEKDKKAIIRKTDLTLFETVIKFDKEQFSKVIKAKALTYNHNKKDRVYVQQLIKEYINNVNTAFKLEALEYSLQEQDDCFSLSILFYNYNFTDKKSIVKYLKSSDYKTIKEYLRAFNKLGFSFTKTKRQKQRVTKKLTTLFDKLDKMLEN